MIRSCPFPSRPGIPRTSLPILVAYNNHEPDVARVIKLKGTRRLPVELLPRASSGETPGRAAGADDTLTASCPHR